MHWFIKDSKFYIGPVAEQDLDALLKKPELAGGGVACSASKGRVETYVTVPATLVSRRVIGALKKAPN